MLEYEKTKKKRCTGAIVSRDEPTIFFRLLLENKFKLRREQTSAFAMQTKYLFETN